VITYSKLLVRVAELYFGEQENGVRADIIRHLQRPDPIEGVRCTSFYTIIIDLSRPESELLSEMDSNTRYEVRRAIDKDQLTSEVHLSPGPDTLQSFCYFYDQFAARKGLPRANRAKLNAFLKASCLALSCSLQHGDGRLVWHAYIRTSNCVRQLHSASLFRSEADKASRRLVGRANRFLHWADILHFKSAGMSIFDMGGWYEGTTDQDRLRINEFKQGFGGKVVKTFNAEVAATWKGELVLRGLGIIGKVRP